MGKIQKAILIDDDESDHFFFERTISNSGQIGATQNFFYAEEALKFLQSSSCDDIDVIFVDINMPRMNGFEFVEQATKTLGDKLDKMKIVMLTTSLSSRDRDMADKYPEISMFINKPLESHHIEEIADLI